MGWFGWMHGVTGVNAACDWLAATSCECWQPLHCIKGTVSWHEGMTRRGERGNREQHEEGTYCRLIASLF
jgi:hypothetical protein